MAKPKQTLAVTEDASLTATLSEPEQGPEQETHPDPRATRTMNGNWEIRG